MTKFLLKKPWYASTKHNTAADTDADVDSSSAGADPKRNSTSASKADEEQQDEGFWIPQATPDGNLFYYNTLTGAARPEPPESFQSTDPSSDWETTAMDSSQLPYADREDRVDLGAVAHERARISGDENDDIHAKLAELDGQYPISKVGSSEAQDWTRQNVEQPWQAILARSERNRVAGVYSGRLSDYFDIESIVSSNSHAEQAEAVHAEVQESKLDVGSEGSDVESIISSTSNKAEHAGAVHARMRKFKSADHFGAEARREAKRDRWQRFRSITKFFGR